MYKKLAFLSTSCPLFCQKTNNCYDNILYRKVKPIWSHYYFKPTLTNRCKSNHLKMVLDSIAINNNRLLNCNFLHYSFKHPTICDFVLYVKRKHNVPRDFVSAHIQVEQIMLWIHHHSLAAITLTTVITTKNNNIGYLQQQNSQTTLFG